ERVSRRLAYLHAATAETLAASLDVPRDLLDGALHELAKRGQAVYDVAAEIYRYRPALPFELSESVLGPEPPEIAEGRRLFASAQVSVRRTEQVSPTRRFVEAVVARTHCEALFDADGNYARAKCSCSFFHKSRLRAGPCRHLLALK